MVLVCWCCFTLMYSCLDGVFMSTTEISRVCTTYSKVLVPLLESSYILPLEKLLGHLPS